ncbi:MAG: hypothetical protein K5750_03485 [Eubacterium sp.]|nr:hypothetical protein [Eubacterium sp.]
MNTEQYKVRRSDKGKDSFDNALDAMAIIEKHVPGFSIHSIKLINSRGRPL